MQPNLAVSHLRRLRPSSFKGLVNCLFVEEAVLLIVLGFGLSFMRQKFVKKVSSVGTVDCPIKVHSSPETCRLKLIQGSDSLFGEHGVKM